jgi:hypothetical protein
MGGKVVRIVNLCGVISVVADSGVGDSNSNKRKPGIEGRGLSHFVKGWIQAGDCFQPASGIGSRNDSYLSDRRSDHAYLCSVPFNHAVMRKTAEKTHAAGDPGDI